MATPTTVIGGAMLLPSVTFLLYGVRSAARDRNLATGKGHPGVYIPVGFALLTTGSPIPLLASSSSRCSGLG